MHTKSYSSHLNKLRPHWTSSLPVLSVLDSGKHHSTFDFARSTFRMSTYKKNTESVFLCLARCIWRHVPYFHQCCCQWQDFIHLLVSNLLCVSSTFHLSTYLPTDTCFYFLEWVHNAAESAVGSCLLNMLRRETEGLQQALLDSCTLANLVSLHQ